MRRYFGHGLMVHGWCTATLNGVMEKLTYLVANYNQAPYVGDCLDSLAAQTDDGWSCLICDDASTDDSLAVITDTVQRLGLTERVCVISQQSNVGYIGTLRRLIEEASTDIVAILDPDDALEPEATVVLREVYAADPQVEFACSKMRGHRVDMTPLGDVYGRAPYPGRTSLRGEFLVAIRSFRRRAYWRTAGYEDNCLYAEDRDLTHKLEEVTHPVFIDRALYRYRRGVPGAQSHDPDKLAAMYRGIFNGRCMAVRRRLRGPRRWFALCFFYVVSKAPYWRGSHRLGRVLDWLDGQFDIMANGECLRRGARPVHLPPYCILESAEAARHGAV